MSHLNDIDQKQTASQSNAVANNIATGGNKMPAVSPVIAATAVAQLAPEPMSDENIKALASFTALGKDKEEDELTDENVATIKDGTYALTAFNGVKCNCFGWALGEDLDTGDKGKIYNWKEDHKGASNFTAPDSGDAKIMLWGDKEGAGEDNWDVLHASIKLTHAELLERSGKFKGLNVTRKQLTDSGIPDPFWSSAGGMGYGIFVHPRDWFEGGAFGVALKGMKGA